MSKNQKNPPNKERNKPSLTITLPAALNDWLHEQSLTETRTVSAIVSRAIEAEKIKIDKTSKRL
jgi:hypothetical protein